MALFICQSCGNEFAEWSGKCLKCGNTEIIQLSQQTDKMIEKVIKGKYKIVRKLGQGGMGAVYLAEQLGIGHRVALKFLKSEFSTDAEIARRFLNEAKSYARVAHPNAVTLHDFGQDEDGNLFIAMEYCEGVDLKKILQDQKRLHLAEAIDVTLQVADVLANAHSKGVVHRDLKPENIMVRKGMRGLHVKVLDFGIARLTNEATKLTQAGSIAGTPRYMSPEQVEGRPDIDNRADVYAVGILLFEMLTGIQPFDGTTISDILRKQVTQAMPHLNVISPELDHPDVDRVIQKASAKNRDERYPDMTALAAELAQAMPTQAGKSLPAIATGNYSPVGQATPAPAPLGTEHTFMSSPQFPGPGPEAGVKTQVAPGGKPTGPIPLVGGVSAINPSGAIAPVEAPLVAPRSNGPMIGAAIAGVLVLAAAGYFAFSRSPEPVKQRPPVVELPPQPPQPPEVVVNTPPPLPLPPPPKVETTGLSVMEEQLAQSNMAQAKQAWSMGDIERAASLVSFVPDASEAVGQAQELRKQIDELKTLTQRAASLLDCGASIPIYEKALRLNGHYAPAMNGLAKCRNGSTPTSLDP